MGGKTLRLHPWSATISLIFLFYLAQHVQISNAIAYCQYYKPGQSWPSIMQCPYTCCSVMNPTKANATCCQPVTLTAITTTTTTFTIFGYRWWIIFVSAICIFTALSIITHYSKRIRIFKHRKNFNSMVDPLAAFTISQNDSKINCSVGDNTIIIEQNPPPYSSSVSPPPPPYASMN